MKLILLFLTLLTCTIGYSQIPEQAVQKEAIGFLGYNEQAIASLGSAFPEEKFNWKPAEGVRSVGEVILHVANSNYYFLMNLGIPPPASVDMMNLEKIQGKDKILETFHASFQFLKDNLLSVKDAQLTEKIKFPWAEMSKHAVINLLIDHSGEHKGQLIAYARSNGIVPPWSN